MGFEPRIALSFRCQPAQTRLVVHQLEQVGGHMHLVRTDDPALGNAGQEVACFKSCTVTE